MCRKTKTKGKYGARRKSCGGKFMESSIQNNIRKIREEISENPFGERVNIVAATKTRTEEEIKEAMAGGIDAVAENKAQEFRDKNDLLPPFPRHFIGRLQENKLKYIVGKVQLIQSCDSEKIARAISAMSLKRGVVSNVLLEVNIGGEESKGGFLYEDAEAAYRFVRALQNIRPCGFMAMLPAGIGEEEGGAMVKKMRALLDKMKANDADMSVLSMGMSGDYKLCVQNGSNMVRIGTGIFGAGEQK